MKRPLDQLLTLEDLEAWARVVPADTIIGDTLLDTSCPITNCVEELYGPEGDSRYVSTSDQIYLGRFGEPHILPTNFEVDRLVNIIDQSKMSSDGDQDEPHEMTAGEFLTALARYRTDPRAGRLYPHGE